MQIMVTRLLYFIKKKDLWLGITKVIPVGVVKAQLHKLRFMDVQNYIFSTSPSQWVVWVLKSPVYLDGFMSTN